MRRGCWECVDEEGVLGVISTMNGWGFSAVHDGCLGQDHRPLVDSLLLASSSSTYNS